MSRNRGSKTGSEIKVNLIVPTGSIWGNINPTLTQEWKERTMARRRHQAPRLGRKHWDAKLERWEVRYREDVLDSATGKVKRIRKKAHFTLADYPTRALAQQALEELLKPINAAEYKPTRILTFAQYAETWVKNTLSLYKVSSRQSSTVHVNLHLIPAFGHLQLRDLKAEVVQEWTTKAALEGKLAPRYIKGILATLAMMWNSEGGVRKLGLATHNPCEGIRKPVVGESVTYAFSEQETRSILFAFEGREQDHLILRLMAESGMRPGEVPALEIPALDFENLKINIVKAATHNQLHSPKGKGPGKKRTLIMSALLAADLKRHLQGDTKGFVFLEDDGRMFSIDAFRYRLNKVLDDLGIRAKAEAIGVDRLGLYPIRHGTNTDMVANGVDTKTRMLQVGHSQEETNRIYDHGNEALMREYVNRRAERIIAKTEGTIQ
jgi:integrase